MGLEQISSMNIRPLSLPVDLIIVRRLRLWKGVFFSENLVSKIQLSYLEWSLSFTHWNKHDLERIVFPWRLYISSYVSPKEDLGCLWQALTSNSTMTSLSFSRICFRFIDQQWEHEFIVSVLPNLSLTELSFLPEIRTQHENRLFWNNLSQNITLTKLNIPWIDTTLEAWEHDFIAALPDRLTLKIIKIGNFQPRVLADWDRLCE
jgi:hypothetical protein